MEGIAEEIYEINPVLFEIRDWFLDIVNTREIKLNTTLEICFLIALDLYELEQKGVLEDEFQSYKNTIDIWKIQDAIGENGTITEERLEEYNLLFWMFHRFIGNKIFMEIFGAAGRGGRED